VIILPSPVPNNIIWLACIFFERPTLPQRRQKKIPKRSGELTFDERQTDPEQAFKTEVYYLCLNTVITQMKSRFTDEVLSVIQQMSFFTHSGLLSKEERKEEEITELCKHCYGLDSSCVVMELNEFRTVYRNVHHMINVDDMIDRTRKSTNLIDKEQSVIGEHITEVDADDDGGSDESGDESDGSYCSTEGHGAKPDVDLSSAKRWIEHSFVKPLRVLEEISSYPYLAAMYKILASLAVTSASAERVLSRVRVI